MTCYWPSSNVCPSLNLHSVLSHHVETDRQHPTSTCTKQDNMISPEAEAEDTPQSERCLQGIHPDGDTCVFYSTVKGIVNE